MTEPIAQRKSEHITLALSDASQFPHLKTGFDDFHFMHQALPEMDLADIDLSTKCLGKTLQAPLLIASMTGGPVLSGTINQNLALAAQQLGLGMGVGSQRITFEQPATLASFQIRNVAPDILLLSNLGAVQLNYGFGVDECRQAVTQIGADGLFFHLNPLQEAIQPEGNTRFSGLLDKIRQVCEAVDFPVLIKECGCGISAPLAQQLKQAGVQGIDVSGAGGTSWALIESQRAPEAWQRQLGQTFADWGIPTVTSLYLCRQADPQWLVIASGGIRNGLDAAKALAMGADLVSLAQPLLAPATQSVAAVGERVHLFLQELRVAMFCVGAKNLAELRHIPLHQRPHT